MSPVDIFDFIDRFYNPSRIRRVALSNEPIVRSDFGSAESPA